MTQQTEQKFTQYAFQLVRARVTDDKLEKSSPSLQQLTQPLNFDTVFCFIIQDFGDKKIQSP